MTRLVGARSLVGRPVVTLRGDLVGEVKDVVFSAGTAAVIGFTLNGRGVLAGPLGEAVPWSAVHAVGSRAIMITDGDQLEPQDSVLAGAAPAGRDVVGDTVLTVDGHDLGQVVDVVVEVAEDARVVGYEIEPGDGLSDRGGRHVYISLPDTMSVSGEALVVPAGAAELVHDDLSGFAAAIDEFGTQAEDRKR